MLDNANKGIILISWGSNIKSSSLEEAKVQGILRALRKLPLQIIWKWENDTLANKPDNVFIQSWLPQREILCMQTIMH